MSKPTAHEAFYAFNVNNHSGALKMPLGKTQKKIMQIILSMSFMPSVTFL